MRLSLKCSKLLSPALWPSQTSLFLVNLDFCNCIGLSSRNTTFSLGTGAWHHGKWELNFLKLFRVHLPAALGSLAVDWHISWLFLKKQLHWILIYTEPSKMRGIVDNKVITNLTSWMIRLQFSYYESRWQIIRSWDEVKHDRDWPQRVVHLVVCE